jgi:hypothetical protein
MITDHHHLEVAGLNLLLLSAAPATAANLMPCYLAVGGTSTQSVPAGTVITRAMKWTPPRSN